MNEERTGKYLRQVEHIRGHLEDVLQVVIIQIVSYIFSNYFSKSNIILQ